MEQEKNKKKWWQFQREEVMNPNKKWWQFQMTKKDKYWIIAVILLISVFYIDEFAGENEIISNILGFISLGIFVLIFIWIFKGIRGKK